MGTNRRGRRGGGGANDESTPSPVGYTHTLFFCRHRQAPSIRHELFLLVAPEQKSSFQAPLTLFTTRSARSILEL